MSRLKMVSPKEAPADVKELYDAVRTAVGMVPNALKVIANSPAVFQGFMNFNTALGAGKLPGALREQVAVAVAQHNRCHY
jgi:alkylhydroperoxidase family enzyme